MKRLEEVWRETNRGLAPMNDEQYLSVKAALYEAYQLGYKEGASEITDLERTIERLQKSLEEEQDNVEELSSEKDAWEDISETDDKSLADILTKRGYVGALTKTETLIVGE